MEHRCEFWLPNKRRFCANSPLPNSKFCGNHNPVAGDQRAPCPIDPSQFSPLPLPVFSSSSTHSQFLLLLPRSSISLGNLEAHLKKCPMKKQAMELEAQPYYRKGINAGGDEGTVTAFVTSEEKRNAIYMMSVGEFWDLVRKIKSVHSSTVSKIGESFLETEACSIWLKNQQQDRQLPFQEKHVVQQASILGNMEAFGILNKLSVLEPIVPESPVPSHCLHQDEVHTPAVVEFGAGRGYLTQMLADCYGINKVFLVERRSYKLKADRSMRQNKSMILERLRIDIEDLDLCSIESLRGVPYLAIGKHICGPATDLTLRCCLRGQYDQNKDSSSDHYHLKGLALATCCHHLCQWQHYINKKFLTVLGITKDEFHTITWFSSWAVDADHSSIQDHFSQDEQKCPIDLRDSEREGVEATIRSLKAAERASLGFMCKDIIDIGRLLWLEDHGLDANLVKYVPSNISPENHLLVGKLVSHN